MSVSAISRRSARSASHANVLALGAGAGAGLLAHRAAPFSFLVAALLVGAAQQSLP